MKPIDPKTYNLSPRTKLLENNRGSLFVLIDRKSRVVMKDGHKIVKIAEDIKKVNQNKKIEIVFKDKIKTKNGHYVFGISNRLEQVIANLLDNSISFSQDNQKIEIGLEETSSNILLSVKDEGPGFAETSPQKIFKRFYSNRPTSFGKHSGLGLNIVKNIVQLHKGTVAASNRLNAKGAQVEVLLPKVS